MSKTHSQLILPVVSPVLGPALAAVLPAVVPAEFTAVLAAALAAVVAGAGVVFPSQVAFKSPAAKQTIAVVSS